MTTHAIRRAAAAGLVAGLMSVTAADAIASEGSAGQTKSGYETTYTADAGERNKVEIANTDKTRVTDRGVALIHPPATDLLAPCSFMLNTMECPTSYLAQLDLRDRNDAVVASGIELSVSGGDGSDTIRTDSRVLFNAGAGADDLIAPAGMGKWVYGSGGPVTVTLDGVANDGLPGEGDNVRPGTGEVTTYNSASNLTGDDTSNRFDVSGTGSSTLVGNGGDDQLATSQPGGSTMSGGDGNDSLYGYTGVDNLDGGDGNDHLQGYYGPGDVLNGGAGDDIVESWDGDPDTVDCGDGNDTAVVDALDTVTNCETVQYGY